MASPSDGKPPQQTPQQGTMTYPRKQAINAYPGVKKGQSGSVSGNSGGNSINQGY